MEKEGQTTIWERRVGRFLCVEENNCVRKGLLVLPGSQRLNHFHSLSDGKELKRLTERRQF